MYWRRVTFKVNNVIKKCLSLKLYKCKGRISKDSAPIMTKDSLLFLTKSYGATYTILKPPS
jgi:hypothetical protein